MRLLPASLILLGTSCLHLPAQAAVDDAAIEAAIDAVTPRVVEWRRDIHQHPELGNRETRTSALVARHLKSLGLDVRTGIAHTGVVGVLRGGRPGPTVALRADMDGLPVTEQVDLPFKSTVTAEYRGQTVGVMHACGHDGHTAMLMGAAEVLVKLRAQLPGTVIFVFQPAEEGAPDGEQGGAPLMAREGVFGDHKPDAVFALHLLSWLNAGQVGLRPGAVMAGSDRYRIVVKGKQTHGARPWGGVDPIVVASQIVLGLQTVVSRQLNIAEHPAVLSVGAIKGGIRFNIIPDEVEMVGTFRTFSAGHRTQIIEAIERNATGIAAASGATAMVEFADDSNPVNYNDPALTERMMPTLRRVIGEQNVVDLTPVTASEDFPLLAPGVPSLYLGVGSTPVGQDGALAPSNHSPLFYVDEAALPVGVRTLTALTVDFLQNAQR